MQVEFMPRTIVDVLLRLSSQTRLGARFVRRNGAAEFYPYRDILAAAQAAAVGLQKRGIQRGDRVALILPTSKGFLEAFLGCQLAGAVPAALYPPFRFGKLEEYFTRTRQMLNKIGARMLITDARVRKLLGPVASGVSSLESAIDVADLNDVADLKDMADRDDVANLQWRTPEVQPDDPAFLQFSSGSTREPKAVIMTHRSLIANLEMMAAAFRSIPDANPEHGGVCWLPLYHDMGLVGCMLSGLYYPATVTYISPEDFIVEPSLWFKTISRYKGIISPAPHFAYRLCYAKIRDQDMEGVDLSSWKLALNGAEPIEIEGMRLFQERFAKWGFQPEAMTPVYGLAEAGLAVTFSPLGAPPLITEFDRELLATRSLAAPGPGRQLPSVGKRLPGLDVEIRDENNQAMGENLVGKIVVRGASITPGFFNDPELTAAAIQDGWLDTGDLGFFHQENLYIAGRAKDLIIIRGRNYAPQEIEDLLFDVPGVRTGCAVAVSASIGSEGEQLIILAEKDLRAPVPENELTATIGERILAGLSLKPYMVQILEPGTLPRTSSGKFRRADALRMFIAGELVPPEKVNAFRLFVELGKSQIAWGRFHLRKES
jgi:acyl-CoA synthetase (AMP-forming)/AMP-acid ligase II